MNKPSDQQADLPIPSPGDRLSALIHMVRGHQVMLDSDLAMLYQVQTKALNQAVKRNAARFPEPFCFQLTGDELKSLRSQIVTSNPTSAGQGGRRYLPYVFTEQGIAMLSAVLRSDTAVEVNLRIMTAFVEMRKFLLSNALLIERVHSLELKQLNYQQSTDERFEQIFNYLANNQPADQYVFFDGQIYDAFSLLTDFIATAERELILVDNYVDLATLNALSKKKTGVSAVIYTAKKTRLSATDINLFNQQYPQLNMVHTDAFHDRFLILDRKTTYHLGASLKDAGKKSFAVTLLKAPSLTQTLLSRLSALPD